MFLPVAVYLGSEGRLALVRFAVRSRVLSWTLLKCVVPIHHLFESRVNVMLVDEDRPVPLSQCGVVGHQCRGLTKRLTPVCRWCWWEACWYSELGRVLGVPPHVAPGLHERTHRSGILPLVWEVSHFNLPACLNICTNNLQ